MIIVFVCLFILIIIIFARNPFKHAAQICEIPHKQRVWIEKTVINLINIYGKEQFLQTRTLLPDYSGFPSPYNATETFAAQVFEAICVIMKLDPDDIDLEFGEAEVMSEDFSDNEGIRYVPGTYTPDYDQIVTLDLNLIHGFDYLVAVIAHELSHVSLDREVLEEIDHSQDDYEATVDIVSIFLGFGLFTARVNSLPIFFNRRINLGYLSLPIICYTLAFIAWKRQEDISAWERYLGKDVIASIISSLQTIEKTHSQQSNQKIEKQAQKRVNAFLNADQMLDHAMAQNLRTISSTQQIPQIERMIEEAKLRNNGKAASAQDGTPENSVS